jgi:hypothetical protein
MKKNPVMNYNSFMSAFKSAEGKYSKKANVSNKDAGDKKINQELATGEVKGSGTAAVSKYTKEHLAIVNKKNIVAKK